MSRRVKQCECPDASASGPRVVAALGEGEGGCLTVTSQIVDFACDVCNTPWRIDAGEGTPE